MKYHVSFDIALKRNPYTGILIAIEGIDGSGKTTQVKAIASILRKQGKRVFVTKNPTNGIVGRLIRKILNGKIHVSPVSFQYLYSADRQLQQEEIIPHLKRGEIVITDRYFWSAVAYGLSDKKGKYSNADMLMAAHSILSMYHQQIVPDYTFYLDISVEIALIRLAATGKHDIYEKREKLETIKREYQSLITRFKDEFIVMDATQNLKEVTESIINRLSFGDKS